MSLDVLQNTITPDNPWPGLQSFDEAACEFFHGRGDETEALLRLIRRERLTVFYGQSGLGKTSLLRAGLFPRLRLLNLLPVVLRLDYSEQAPPFVEQVTQALAEACRACHVEATPPAPNDSLWAYFHRDDVDFWDVHNRLVVPVLVFDQFEERFTLGRRSAEVNARAEAFLDELSQVVENRPPIALRAQFEADPDVALAYDFEKQTCKVVLSLREDFLPELEGLLDRFPSLNKGRLRLLPMSTAQAVQVVLGSGSHLVSETVASAIVNFVAYSRQHRAAGEVEPALLSLVLQELNLRRLQRGEARIDAELLSGSQEKILEEFYERAVKDLPANARFFLEDGLLTGSGYRDSIPWENARNKFGVDDECLATLINRHLIRREERLGLTRLELVHDLLTGVIADSRRRRLEREHWRQETEKEWQLKNERAVAAAARLSTAAEDWNKDRQGRASVLLQGPLLCQASELLEKHPDLMQPQAREFVVESQRRQRRGRLLWTIIAILALSVLFWNAIMQKNEEFLLVFLPSMALFVTPCILPVIDRLPKRTSCNTFAASAWRWSIYSWGAFLIGSYYGLNPNNFGEVIFGAFLIGAIFVVPVFKWKAYVVACRNALEPAPHVSTEPKVALLITVALLPIVIVTASLNPSFFKRGHSVTTAYTTNDMGWIVKTVTDPSKPGRKASEVSYFQPATLRDDGYATIKKEYDQYSKVRRATYHGVNGEPVLHKNGSHGWTAEYDGRGNEVVWTALGFDGRPITLSDGYATIKKEYDQYSKVRRATYHGVNGEPVLHKNGSHGWTAEYDGRGNEVVWTALGFDGRPITLSDGYATIKKEYDRRGKVTRRTYHGADGEPVLHKDGNHGWTAAYDGRGNEITATQLGLDGKPAVSDGYATIKKEYDRRDKVTRGTFYGIYGEPVQHKSGAYGWAAEYDERGNEVVWTALELAGKPAVLREGYATLKRQYDERGNLVQVAYFDEHGQPAHIRDSYHKVTVRYDAHNGRIEEIYWDTENQKIDPLAIVRRAMNADVASQQAFLTDLLGQASWYALLGSKPSEAVLYAEEVLRIDPSKKWVITNQAHGYLFSGQFEQAMAIYVANKDTDIELNGSKTTFRQAVLDDFKVFREKGLAPSALEKIEALLAAASHAKEE